MADRPAVLSVQDLTVDFETSEGTVNVLDHVSFELGEGEMLGLLGESGAGKSVLADAILRLIPEPPGKIAGKVLLYGTDLLQLTEAELSQIRGKQIAMIFQDPTSALNPVFRVGHQVAEPMEIHLNLAGGRPCKGWSTSSAGWASRLPSRAWPTIPTSSAAGCGSAS